MRKVIAFNFITLNGYYKGPKGDISWHRHGEEENEYAARGLQSGSTLLFGRVTYEMMAGYWPTPDAINAIPEVAAGMNNADKIVFSRTLKKAAWNNTRLVKNNMEEEIRKLKQLPGNDMTVLGSGSIVTQLAEVGLIDEYQLMIDPVALMRLDLQTKEAQPSPEQLQIYMKQYQDWVGGIAAQNKFKGGTGLSTEGKVVKSNNVITDGPFAEIKESIAGFIIVRAEDFDEAVRMAKACPILGGEGNSVEVRKVVSVDNTR